MPLTVPVFSHTDGSHLPVCALILRSQWMMHPQVTLRKSGACITMIYTFEDKLYLRCFQEHRRAEWAALSGSTSLMKETSDCNLALLFHRHRQHTYTLSAPFSSEDFGRWSRLCLARSFPTLKKLPLLSLMKASHNSGIVMTGLCTTLSLPLLDRAFVFTAGWASPTTEQGRGEKTSAPLQC